MLYRIGYTIGRAIGTFVRDPINMIVLALVLMHITRQ